VDTKVLADPLCGVVSECLDECILGRRIDCDILRFPVVTFNAALRDELLPVLSFNVIRLSGNFAMSPVCNVFLSSQEPPVDFDTFILVRSRFYVF
jgi:hypothetical protein